MCHVSLAAYAADARVKYMDRALHQPCTLGARHGLYTDLLVATLKGRLQTSGDRAGSSSGAYGGLGASVEAPLFWLVRLPLVSCLSLFSLASPLLFHNFPLWPSLFLNPHPHPPGVGVQGRSTVQGSLNSASPALSGLPDLTCGRPWPSVVVKEGSSTC